MFVFHVNCQDVQCLSLHWDWWAFPRVLSSRATPPTNAIVIVASHAYRARTVAPLNGLAELQPKLDLTVHIKPWTFISFSDTVLSKLFRNPANFRFEPTVINNICSAPVGGCFFFLLAFMSRFSEFLFWWCPWVDGGEKKGFDVVGHKPRDMRCASVGLLHFKNIISESSFALSQQIKRILHLSPCQLVWVRETEPEPLIMLTKHRLGCRFWLGIRNQNAV